MFGNFLNLRDGIKYRCSDDWFSPNIPVWEKFLKEFKNKPNLRYLEIGVYEGRSFFWMLNNILRGRGSRAVAVDIFAPDYEATFRRNLAASGFGGKVKVYKGFSRDIFKKLSSHRFDIVYIDGAHTGRSVMFDAVAFWELLNDGGLMILDDYGNAKMWESGWPLELTTHLAIDTFLTVYRNELQVVHSGYQLIVRKLYDTHREKYLSSGFWISFGRYRYCYSYEKGGAVFLYDSVADANIDLPPEEGAILHKLAMGRSVGEPYFRIDKDLAKDPIFLRLKQRLNDKSFDDTLSYA